MAVDEDFALPDDDGEGSLAPARGGGQGSLAPAVGGAQGSLAPAIGGAPSQGGEDGAGLLFPLPGGGNLEDAEDLENSVDPEDYAEDISEVDDLGGGPSDPNIIQGGSSCQVLVLDFGEP